MRGTINEDDEERLTRAKSNDRNGEYYREKWIKIANFKEINFLLQFKAFIFSL